MADNLTKQLIETVKNKVPLNGGLSIKGYPVMGTLSDMKNFKIEEGVLKLRYGTKRIATFKDKRFYFLKNFEFCNTEVLIGLDYQLCLHAFFENWEGYDFIVRDASIFHKNQMIWEQGNDSFPENNNYRGNNYWEAGRLFKNGTQFWAYENQKYIMFFNDYGEIRVIVKDGGFKMHATGADQQNPWIEVDIKDATNRIFDNPPALQEDKRNVAPRITGEYRFARVNELGVISELTEPQYLQTNKSVFAFNGDLVMPINQQSDLAYDNVPPGYSYYSWEDGTLKTNNTDNTIVYQYFFSYGYLLVVHSNGRIISSMETTSDSDDDVQEIKVTQTPSPLPIQPGVYLISPSWVAGKNLFYLDIPIQSINDIFYPSIKTERHFFKISDEDISPEYVDLYYYGSGVIKAEDFYNDFYKNQSESVPTNPMFGYDTESDPPGDNIGHVFVNALPVKMGEADSIICYAINQKMQDYYLVPKNYYGDVQNQNARKGTYKIYKLKDYDDFASQSKGQMFTYTHWYMSGKHCFESQISGEGKIYPIKIPLTIMPNVSFKTNSESPETLTEYKMESMDTLVASGTKKIYDELGFETTDYNGIIYSKLTDNGRFAIWNDNKILGISQRLFVDKNNINIPVYKNDNVDPNNLLVRYSPILSLEFMNQRSLRFELPLIRRAIRKPQYLCVSNNYVYEFEDNRLWYGSAYDFMLTGYSYLDGSLLKLISYNEGVLACTTSGLYYVNREVVQPVVNGRAIRADFAGETQVGGIVIAGNKVYIVRTEITDSGARIETANLISEPINELVFNGEIKLACNKRQLYLADDYNVYGFDTQHGIWNLRYNYNNKHIANIFILDNRLGVLFDNEVDAAVANEEINPVSPR